MYTPPSFAGPHQSSLHEFIENHSFATLISSVADDVAISHLPLLLNRHQGRHGALLGHMAKANPHWKEADGQKTFAIFHGPHAYISPTWYESTNVVPTWNYVVVHASGIFRLDDSREVRLEIVRRSVDQYEQSMPSPWSLDVEDESYVDRLLDAIVGFRIDIEHLEGKWKLRQNQDGSRRQKVAEGLSQLGGDNNNAIARLIADGLS